MLSFTVFLFAVAALGGLLLAIRHFQGKERPWALGIVHALLAATALILLLIPVLGGGLAATTAIKWVVGLFVVAALGGVVLFINHLQRKRLPSAVVLIHGGVAVAAFLILVVTLYV